MLAPELRRIADAVGTIHVDTQQRTEAINAAQESQRRQKDIAPLWIENIVTKYEQVERDKATADERHYRVQNSLKRATWCAFFAASFYGAVAVFQWWTMHTTYQEIQKQTAAAQCAARAATDAAKTAKESLVSVQRAFVFLPLADKGYTGDLVGPQHSIAELPFVLENSGTTPTRNLRFHFNRRFSPSPLPKNFAFPDEWSPHEDKKGTPSILGPKGTIEASYEYIPVADVIKITMNQGYFYVWGWVTYNDIFIGTDQHLTRFCIEVDPRGQPFVSGAQTQFKIAKKYCDRNNCYDDECKNQ